jgi:hypothetical protein
LFLCLVAPPIVAGGKTHFPPKDNVEVGVVRETNVNRPLIKIAAIWSFAWTIYDHLVGLVARVIVAHPAKVKLIAEARVKTDKVDVLTLAKLLHADMLPEVWVPLTIINVFDTEDFRAGQSHPLPHNGGRKALEKVTILPNVDDSVVQIYGETAVLTCRVHDQGQIGTEQFDACYRSLFVWARQRREWRCVIGQTTATTRPG